MDEKFIERPTKFDKRAYDNNYQKTHYAQFNLRIAPELKQRIDNYCKNNNISKSEFLRLAIDTLDK